MASSSKTTPSSQLLLIFVPLLLSSHLNCSEAQGSDQPIVDGLSWSFYESSCPRLESIVRNQLQRVFDDDIGQAAGLLHIHFHDCFVQGCNGSVLLNGSASDPSEQDAPPNLNLGPEAFRIIDDLRRRVHGVVVESSLCADITALAARDAVVLSGGPNYSVPLGRRDGLSFATRNETIANLPSPSLNTTTILTLFATKNFDPTDVVALSGGHTIGISHCSSFDTRLYPNQDPTMDQTFANNLRHTCQTNKIDNTTFMDIRSPNTFDNRYYVDLINRQGLFTSDQDLYTDRRTRSIVTSFAANQTFVLREVCECDDKDGTIKRVNWDTRRNSCNRSARNSNNHFLSLGGGSSGKLGRILKVKMHVHFGPQGTVVTTMKTLMVH